MSTIEKTIDVPDSILIAENVTYDNSASGLSATNVNAAIDELTAKVGEGSEVDLSTLGALATKDTVSESDLDTALQEKISDAQSAASAAEEIAKGKNQARVFNTTDDMYTWLADEANKGVAQVGDNLYIVDVGVPDWWIAEVLDTPNDSGYYYELGQLETQKVDLTTIEAALANKVDKVDGKGLSTNDYTTAEKNKLAGIVEGAQVNAITGIKGNAESSYRTGNVNLTPANIGAAESDHTHAAATTSVAGLMSAADKTKLEGIAAGANAYSHPNSGATAGTYRSVTVNAQGHVTSGTNPTLAIDQGGTGATDAATARANLGAAASGHNHSAATTSVAGFMSAADKTKLEGIAAGAQANQNAFANVVVGSTAIAADTASDTLTLVAGTNVTLTPDANNDKVTIEAKDTTYSAATTLADGLMSATDKAKLDGVAEGANAYTHPTSGVTAGTYRNVTVDANGHVTSGNNATLPVTQGGTGATNASEARSRLGLSEVGYFRPFLYPTSKPTFTIGIPNINEMLILFINAYGPAYNGMIMFYKNTNSSNVQYDMPDSVFVSTSSLVTISCSLTTATVTCTMTGMMGFFLGTDGATIDISV